MFALNVLIHSSTILNDFLTRNTYVLHQKILCKQGHFLNGADEANIRLAETRPPMSMEMILLA